MSKYDSHGQEYTYTCSGTPISEDVILTAAHCVKGFSKIVAAFANDASCASGFRVKKDGIEASSFAYDQEFTESGYNGISHDVGLVRLKSKIPADYDISPLYKGDALSSDEVTLVGFGATSESNTGVGYLRSKKKSFANDVRVSSSKVTIQQNEGGLCKGDSGSPVFVEVNGQKQILGVTSYVSNPYQVDEFCHGTSTAMSAQSILPWITETIDTLK
jgi:V8-like Glu-specific endopeptidase